MQRRIETQAEQHQPAPAAKQHTQGLMRLAWRNIWRHKRRTALLVIVVAYATLSTIFFWGFIEGYTESILNNQARLLSAPVLITNSNYLDDPDPENALPHLAFTPILGQASAVRAAALRLDFPGLLRSPYTSQALSLRGIELPYELRVSTLAQHIDEGRMLQARNEIVLGGRLARRLDVRLGERVAVDVSSLAGPQGMGLILVGILETGVSSADEMTALVHIDDARALTGVETATGIALDVPRGLEERSAANLNRVLPQGIRAFGIMELIGALRAEVEGSRIQMIPIGLLFAIFAAAAVTSTLVVSIMERQREFGMMAAIGLAPPRLARMVVMEALATTLFGWLLGLLLGYGLNAIFAYWNILGPIFSSASESFSQFGLSDEIYTSLSPWHALYASVTVIFAALLALLFPARQVAKLDPVTAMRSE